MIPVKRLCSKRWDIVKYWECVQTVGRLLCCWYTLITLILATWGLHVEQVSWKLWLYIKLCSPLQTVFINSSSQISKNANWTVLVSWEFIPVFALARCAHTQCFYYVTVAQEPKDLCIVHCELGLKCMFQFPVQLVFEASFAPIFSELHQLELLTWMCVASCLVRCEVLAAMIEGYCPLESDVECSGINWCFEVPTAFIFRARE